MTATAGDNNDSLRAGAEKARRDGPQRRAWRKFGPYLAERQWGTVREDRHGGPNSWDSFPHDHARSRAYRYGEDGIAGFSDDQALLCFSLGLWNENDPILKERYFGLSNGEGNHGEDAKEYWFYLDATPTSSYLKTLYKYPQQAYPYADLVDENTRRDLSQPEYELLDTGIFDEHRYFDVVTEYAKAAPDDICIQITATNRGPDAAPLHLVPTLWFRNTWSGPDRLEYDTEPLESEADPDGTDEPEIPRLEADGDHTIRAHHNDLGDWVLRVGNGAELLFCDNETNTARLFGAELPDGACPKDGINDYLLGGASTVRPEQYGTKAAAHLQAEVPAGESVQLRLRLTAADVSIPDDPFGSDFEQTIADRQQEADDFYDELTAEATSAERSTIMRQALAGMLWSQQYYGYEVATWLRERGTRPFVDRNDRNGSWPHLRASHIISMPDPWEYPWFAAWDLAFHTLSIALVDIQLAKEQVEVLLTDDYLHPAGQIPAYEWDFDDVNPPVHAWAAYLVFEVERVVHGTVDHDFLNRIFDRLLLNFTWWVNRKDPDGNNIFSGGFLGLDNIGVFDRSAELPSGVTLDQADGTAWVAEYCQTMLAMAVELAHHDHGRLPLVRKFAEHYVWIAAQVYGTEGGSALWDEEDKFFYDNVRFDDGHRIPLRVRSLVGLLPLAASVAVRPPDLVGPSALNSMLEAFEQHFGEYLPLVRNLPPPNSEGLHLVSLVDEHRLTHLLDAMLAEDEFLSPHGIRSLSRRHLEQPYSIDLGDQSHSVSYVAGDSDSNMFGGNSNWRGPVWFPVNLMLIRGLLELHAYYGDEFTVECPTGSGNQRTLAEVAEDIINRLIALFELDEDGNRPANGRHPMWQDEHWRDHIVFYEYFHGDNGEGLGASHQTGWTGLVALLIHLVGDDSLMRLVGHNSPDFDPVDSAIG